MEDCSRTWVHSQPQQAKWKSGWRNIHATQDRNESFQSYWRMIHARLGPVERPLARPAPLPSADSSFFNRHLATSPFVMAPMVVLSERAFRILCRRYGVGLCFSPMLTEQRVLKGDCPYAEELLVPCEEDRPLIAQVR